MSEPRENTMPDEDRLPVPPLGYLRCMECDGRFETLEALDRHRYLHTLVYVMARTHGCWTDDCACALSRAYHLARMGTLQ